MTFLTALAIISICLTITLGGLAYGLCYLFRYIRDIDKAKNNEERAREFMDNINDIYESVKPPPTKVGGFPYTKA